MIEDTQPHVGPEESGSGKQEHIIGPTRNRVALQYKYPRDGRYLQAELTTAGFNPKTALRPSLDL